MKLNPDIQNDREIAKAKEFITQSNLIEGIQREPTNAEMNEYFRFMDLTTITIDDVEKFVKVYQPNAKIRSKAGLDVRVGNYFPPKGGLEILVSLGKLLDNINKNKIDAFKAHIIYESIHPFTDGNGRSGRMIWMWQQRYTNLGGFLHSFYYQALDAFHEKMKEVENE